jgi:hypothetical protein
MTSKNGVDEAPGLISEVFQRARTLLAIPVDEEREAEGDAALATYLWVLNRHRQDLARAAADNSELASSGLQPPKGISGLVR